MAKGIRWQSSPDVGARVVAEIVIQDEATPGEPAVVLGRTRAGLVPDRIVGQRRAVETADAEHRVRVMRAVSVARAALVTGGMVRRVANGARILRAARTSVATTGLTFPSTLRARNSIGPLSRN